MTSQKPKTRDAAAGHWQHILSSLGISPEFLSKSHKPCPICGGKDRFRFDNKDGRGTWFCSFCGAGDGFSLLCRFFNWSFARAASEVDAVLKTKPANIGTDSTDRTDEAKCQALRQVWAGSRIVQNGDPVSLYLSRRLKSVNVPSDIRFHPSLRHSNGHSYPSMVALIRNPAGSPVSIHRTYLTASGEKAEISDVKKVMSGGPLRAAAVRLAPISERIGIAEGIETALAASLHFQVGVWAATSAVLLESWTPPIGAKEVLIAGDNDASFTGQASAFTLARRLKNEGYRVQVVIPSRPNTDWADLLPAVN